MMMLQLDTGFSENASVSLFLSRMYLVMIFYIGFSAFILVTGC
jgi:hypothetical protein